MPSLADADALGAVLASLRCRSGPDARSLADPDKLLVARSYRLVGAAASQAMRARHALATAEDNAAADAGTGRVSDEALVAEILGAAGCDSELDALGLLHWLSSCLSQAVEYIDIGGPHGAADPVLGTIGMTAAALSAMLAAARNLRDPDTGLGIVSADAARGWRAAVESLREAVAPDDTSADPGAGHSHACDCGPA